VALLVAGTNSGCGKSTVALGLIAALRKLGSSVQPFKAGPDFIDPGIHTLVSGRISRNLDIWMCGEDFVKRSLTRYSFGANAAVIEGVMGYYDGGERSTASLASVVGAKVVLVIDAYGMAESAGAVLEGFKSFGGRVDAVIFNRVGSECHYDRLRAAAGDVEVLGYLPREARFSIEERHLGLLVADEKPITEESISLLADSVCKHVNMQRVKKLARAEESAEMKPAEVPSRVRIAIAKDPAFCFYYDDNLDMLREAGAELVSFSPLSDEAVPTGVDAIYLGGGYPEMKAPELQNNKSMRESIRSWVTSGRPVYAECGGLMYLGKSMQLEGELYSMAGALPVKTALGKRRSALGYREVSLSEDCILGPAGTRLRGHEFHYSEVVSTDAAGDVAYNVLGEERQEVTSVSYKKTLASYMHLHWGSAPDTAANMVRYIESI
jgi:cobyrinic acid a,c-diamide synthase